MDEVRLSVRNLIEFVLRCGSIDSRFSGFDRANEGSRIHRKLQKAAGQQYHAEVFSALPVRWTESTICWKGGPTE